MIYDMWVRDKVAFAKYKEAGQYMLQKRFDEALIIYREVVKVEPDFFEAYSNIGVCCKNLNMLKEAREAFEFALKLKPNSAIVNNNLGNVYTAMERFDLAKKHYEIAIKLRPRYIDAMRNLGSVLFFTGKTEEAIALHLKTEKLIKGK